jgi:hypothetical protein
MPASLESNAPLLTVAELKEFRFYRSHSPAFNVVEKDFK